MLSQQNFSKRSCEAYKITVVFNSFLFQQYEVLLPNSQSVSIKLANATFLLEKMEILDLKEVRFRVIDDPSKWIQLLVVKKKMGEVKAGPNLLMIGIFDGVIYQKEQTWYGAYLQENTKQIDKQILQNNHFVENWYRSILADYHTLNVVFSKIQVEQMRWKVYKDSILPLIVLGQNWMIVNYQEDHRFWAEKGSSPYEQDFKYLLNVFDEMKKGSLSKQKQDNFYHIGACSSHEDTFQKIMTLLEWLYSKDFESFLTQYSDIYAYNFSFRENEELFQEIKQFYYLKRQYKCLSQLIKWFQKDILSTVKEDSFSLRQLQFSVLELKRIQLMVSIGQLPEKNPFQQIKNIQSIFSPFFLQSSLNCKSSKQPIQSIASAIKKDKREDRLMWHFMQSKINWKQGLFYRALGHLKQCHRLTEDNKMLLVIQLQEGRNWQLLGETQEAQKHYKEGIKLAEWEYGACDVMVLPFLYNLQVIYLKCDDRQSMSGINKEISRIKKRYEKHVRRIMPELSYSLIIEQFVQEATDASEPVGQSEKKGRKLTRDEIMKLQVDRLPVLSQLWNGFKLVLQKNGKNSTPLNLSFDSLKGEFKIHYQFLQLVKLILAPNQMTLSEAAESQMQNCLLLVKNWNKRYYHRFLFCLSYAWETNRPGGAIECLEWLIAESRNLYSHSVRFSIVKRLIFLYKKNKQQNELLNLYKSEDIIGRDDMQEIYQAIQFCLRMQHPLMVIRQAKYYLKGISQYSTISEQILFERGNPSNMLVDRSISVKLALAEAYISMRHYVEVEEIINVIFQSCKVSFWSLRYQRVLLKFVIQSYNANEMELCLSATQKITQFGGLQNIARNQSQNFFIWKLGLINSIKIQQNRREGHINWLKMNYRGEFWEKEMVNEVIDKVLPSLERQQNYSQLVEFLTKIKDRKSKKCISMEDILNKISRVNYLDQVQFPKLVEDFTILLGSQVNSHQYYFNLVIAKIKVLETVQGRSSFNIILLHFLMVIVVIKQKTLDKSLQMQLLFWLAPFKKEIDLSTQLTDFWATKNGRDLRLDELLFTFFESNRELVPSSLLQGLWWKEQVSQKILQLRSQYRNIVDSELGVNDSQLQIQILNFKIKYSSYFGTNLSQSDTLTKLDQILSQLDCPYDFDDI